MKIYISGKITGIEETAPALFAKASEYFIQMGWEVVNPMTLPHDHEDKSWHAYMKEDVKALCECDAIYMLSNWKDSKGAKWERTIAMALGLTVHYESIWQDTLAERYQDYLKSLKPQPLYNAYT